MEVRNESITIKVDNKEFVLDEEARVTMNGAMAFLTCAIQTKKHRELNLAMCAILSKIMVDYQRDKGNMW